MVRFILLSTGLTQGCIPVKGRQKRRMLVQRHGCLIISPPDKSTFRTVIFYKNNVYFHRMLKKHKIESYSISLAVS